MGDSMVNLKPKRIWFGSTIPGKKMILMLQPDMAPSKAIERGRYLIDLYKKAPYEALLYTAIALQVLPHRGAKFGAAFRDLNKLSISASQYGAILTDIRDFLKFRFRVNKSIYSDDYKARDLVEELLQDRLPHNVRPENYETVIIFTVSALDALSRQKIDDINLAKALFKLRDLLRATIKPVLDDLPYRIGQFGTRYLKKYSNSDSL
jgi:hypothetical protein